VVHLIRVPIPRTALDTSKDGVIMRLQSENLQLSEKLIEVECTTQHTTNAHNTMAARKHSIHTHDLSLRGNESLQ